MAREAKIPKITRKKVRGETRYQIDLRPFIIDGKPGGRISFPKRSEAEAYSSQLILNGLLNKDRVSNDDVLIDDAYTEYIKENYYRKKNKLSGKNVVETDRDKTNRYNHYLKPFFASSKVSDINKDMIIDIAEYIQELESIKTGDQISDALQYRLWTDFKGFLSYLYDYEIITNPIRIPFKARIAKPKKKKIIQCWHKNEYEMYLDSIDLEIEKTFFMLLGKNGPRKSEAKGIKFKNVNFNSNEIEIYSQLKNARDGNVRTKTESSNRVIMIDKETMARIKSHMEERKKTGISENELKEQYVFVDKKGNPFSNETLRRHHNEYVNRAGIKYYPIHYLRHYYGTQAIMSGNPVPFVQDQMGHSRGDITVLKYYVEFAEREKMSEKMQTESENNKRRES
ncbi:MAG: site-specific integrase [Erysipelotrichaceae bacterium]|nr:site-specific integrase [Erysipelotrichaceae bacterium]